MRKTPFDLDSRKTTGNLYPLNADQQRRFPQVEKEMKGLSDLQANIDSPEATNLRQTVASLEPEQVRPFMEELQFYDGYSHGTHVAGIFLAGNPYVRVVTARLTWDWKTVPDPYMSRALMERQAASYEESVAFFKRNNVRVVNMSWGDTVKMIADGMEQCATGKDVQERNKLAREWFEIERSALERALTSAPEILFVASAGNTDANSTFDDHIPGALKIANLLTVGAVDKAGDEASFTSYGANVAVDANGYEVESYIPGGDRLRLSGTSMASPNVANLAAKILVVNPTLTPPKQSTSFARPRRRRRMDAAISSTPRRRLSQPR